MPPSEHRPATDHDRVTVIRLLEQARLGQQITAAEQHDRVNHALAAGTLADLSALVDDLGVDTAALGAPDQERRRQQRLVAVVCALVVLVALLGALLLFL